MTNHIKQVWVPQAPDFHCLYANKSDTSGSGIFQHMQPSTRNIHCALQFDTKEECAKWCEENPHPVFVPVEHGFV